MVPRSPFAVATHDRYADTLLGIARTEGPRVTDAAQEEALRRLSALDPNLRRAFQWLLVRRSDAAVELCALLARYWELNGLWFDAHDMMTAALAAGTTDARMRAIVESWLGVFHYRHGRFAEAHALLDRALETLRVAGNEKDVADALNDLGLLADAEGRYEDALAFYTECVGIHERHGDARSLAVSYTNLGNTAGNMERAELAREALMKSLHYAEVAGDRLALGNTLNNLGALEEAQGNYDRAREYHHASLELRESIHDVDGLATSHHNLAYLNVGEGRLDDAVGHLSRAIELYRTIGNRAHLSRALGTLGYLRMAHNDPAGGIALYALSDRINEEIGIVLYADVQKPIDSHLAEARDRIGDEQYERAWNRGRNLSIDEALELATA
jgi:tetratricopeptide (TPR) repeat protein